MAVRFAFQIEAVEDSTNCFKIAGNMIAKRSLFVLEFLQFCVKVDRLHNVTISDITFAISDNNGYSSLPIDIVVQ